MQQAEQALLDRFTLIDGNVKQNISRVLEAFRAHQVSRHHYADETGYAYDDLGRDILDKVFARVMGAEAAMVRVQLVSGTHAIACALFGVLRPGDEMLAVAGPPYDTLEEVIGLRGQGQGSLRDFGIKFRQLELTTQGLVDWDRLCTSISHNTKLVSIQRSRGYSLRPALSIADISRVISIVKQQNPHTICFVDNCYGEFIETQEPGHVGADLMAGSMIKNPGGTVVRAGGYIAGRSNLVEAAACRLTAPGIGLTQGSTFDQRRLLFQGLFLAPQMVGEAMKGTYLTGYIFDKLGYQVFPKSLAPRGDIVQTIVLGSKSKLVAFCNAIQQHCPVCPGYSPKPESVPGYESLLVETDGAFIQGSTMELSADGPLREPYAVHMQGGTHWTHVSIALQAAIDAVGGNDEAPAAVTRVVACSKSLTGEQNHSQSRC